MPNQLTVPFYGSKLFIVEHEGEPYTPMKSIVEGMGLDWRSQATKLRNNKQRWGVANITTPTNGYNQNSLCLPLRKLFGCLQTLSPNKVRPSIRDRVIRYQNECDDVLWQYWAAESRQPAPQVIEPPHQARLLMVMDRGYVVSNQLVENDAVVVSRGQIPALLREPGYFSVAELKAIAETSLDKIAELAEYTEQRF
ncbi:phage antirepressor N-terminal domain-containing protein [Salinivibrio kushneri]|uniref:phage antirepressor N-terminal domain-containing protein n=1 Tax=Salinivibrio kushneri TaxID=1908198 RepID=UPI0009850619|nr:phage antirepressor N-terminal domain-containing protein [Salinivibrio kushneri]